MLAAWPGGDGRNAAELAPFGARQRTGLPDDAALRAYLEPLGGPLLHTRLASGAGDTASVGGAEVDIDWVLEGPAVGSQLAPAPAG
jgi:hypothetical protein